MATKKKTDKELSPNHIKHLELIQGVITRMNSNSFQMKGWMVAIVSALLAIYADKQNQLYLLIAALPAIIFWFLDTYYLWQERKFRAVYNDIVGASDDPKKIQLFTMPVHLYKQGKYSYWSVFFSITIWPLYAPIIGILLGIYFLK